MMIIRQMDNIWLVSFKLKTKHVKHNFILNYWQNNMQKQMPAAQEAYVLHSRHVGIKIFTASDVMWKQMWHRAIVTM